MLRRMKALAPLLLLLATPLLFAEEVTLKQPVVLKSGRNLVSLRPGAVVEVVSRDGSELTIKYKDLTGKIPATKLEDDPNPPPSSAKSAAPAPKAPAPVAKSNKKKAAETKPSEPKLSETPQTGYGKAVKKAKDAAAAHDKNLVRPTDEVLKDK